MAYRRRRFRARTRRRYGRRRLSTFKKIARAQARSVIKRYNSPADVNTVDVAIDDCIYDTLYTSSCMQGLWTQAYGGSNCRVHLKGIRIQWDFQNTYIKNASGIMGIRLMLVKYTGKQTIGDKMFAKDDNLDPGAIDFSTVPVGNFKLKERVCSTYGYHIMWQRLLYVYPIPADNSPGTKTFNTGVKYISLRGKQIRMAYDPGTDYPDNYTLLWYMEPTAFDGTDWNTTATVTHQIKTDLYFHPIT